MMYSPAFLVLFGVMVAGFTIPIGEPNGVYSVNYDNNGTEIHTLIAPALSQEELASIIASRNHQVRNPSRIIGTRQSDATYCGSSFQDLDHPSTDAAVAALKAQCNPGAISSGRDFYSIYGSTVAYVCNLGSNAWLCYQNDLTNDYAMITQVCGWYKSGWRVRWPQGNTGAQIGYEISSAKFCGRGP